MLGASGTLGRGPSLSSSTPATLSSARNHGLPCLRPGGEGVPEVLGERVPCGTVEETLRGALTLISLEFGEELHGLPEGVADFRGIAERAPGCSRPCSACRSAVGFIPRRSAIRMEGGLS